MVSSPGLTTVLIEGNPGTGKTTAARALSMAWMLARVPSDRHRMSTRRAALDVRRGHALKWYRDISLAGLNEGLAEAQLFGVGKKVATGVDPRLGVFEQAMTGARSDIKDSHEKLVERALNQDPIPIVTGGAVLLDEIGDLPVGLQAKLLRVLNGERQYRLGVEGDDRFSFEFCGLAILATWRNVFTLETFRQDLRQRISQHRVRLPGVSEYPLETRIELVRSVWEALHGEIDQERERLERVLDGNRVDPDTDTVSLEWMSQLSNWSKTPATGKMLTNLAAIDWSERGELRGLREVVRRLLLGVPLEEALKRTQGMKSVRAQVPSAEESIAVLNDAAEKGMTLSDWWKSRRCDWAKETLRRIGERDPDIQSFVDTLKGGKAKLKKDLQNIARSNPR